ncbi:MotA/TolQ/ExbB proton channel family protein [Chitinivibrio alkaliphilus]|uniref:Protein TolQ n=1 Tax=Chitinivibrio alkaliphilus ACht1 TaxID=1313304 RepID=U7DDX1_9BACT|nr:MotA/TolQ/ExbB proton channel family protein [Chitinivibrio alkaliphilus]ERP39101.1 protein TolQ [Chitinivibrio alkaliphilus ACht1]
MDIPALHLIMDSGAMAKAVLLLLLIFSVFSWGIIVNRFFVLASVRRHNKRFISFFSSLESIRDLSSVAHDSAESPAGELGRMTVEEFKRIIRDARLHKGVSDWSFYLQNQFYMARERLDAEVGRLARKQDWGLYLLAVVSSVAPFLGLFGTVWGIMLAFYEIGEQASANLAVVAPGISAALITTIVGLAVAIPAVVFYNIFNHKVERIEDELEEFSDHLLLNLKRELFNMLYAKGKKDTAHEQTT